MKHATLLAALVFVALISACNRQGDVPAVAAPLANSEQAKDQGQKLIRTAHVEMEVRGVDDAISQVRRIAQSQSGVVADSELVRTVAGRLQATLTIQVPSERVDATLSEIRKLGQVRSESVNTQDVTKAYFDLETRLRVKRQTEERLRDILRSRTGELSQVLEVERELDRVVGQIEEMEGERKFYDQRIAVSTITIQLTEPGAYIKPGIWLKVRNAFRDSLEVLADSVAGLVYVVAFLVPWLIVIALVAWLATAVKKRRRKP
jgi:hypothetical protein